MTLHNVLTEREIEILQLRADGLSIYEIGKQAHIVANTVKSHFAKMKEKTGALSSWTLVALGFRQGVLK